MRKKEFKVADFGAVGDGVTNDGLAICKALSAALQEPDDIQKEIIFEGEKNLPHYRDFSREYTTVSFHHSERKKHSSSRVRL